MVPGMKRDAQTSASADGGLERSGDRPAAATLRRILVGVDFSPGSEAAVRTAQELAGWSEAAITLVHVADGATMHNGATTVASPDNPSLRRWFERVRKLDDWAQNCRDAGVSAHALVLEGIPCEVLLRLAPAYSLVVLGKPERPEWWRLFSRRTVAAVSAASRTPVMVAYPGAGRKPDRALPPRRVSAPCAAAA